MKAIYDPELSNLDNWHAAFALSEAGMVYATSEVQEDFRNSGKNSQRSAALQNMMDRDVRNYVGTGDLWAIGIRVPSTPEMLPELIPPVMFASDDAAIDWANSTIKALDKEYRQVRICLPDPSIAHISSSEPMATGSRKAGRRNTYPNAKIILAEIFAEYPEYSVFPASGLLLLFNEKYLIRFGSKLRLAPLGERTLRKHLNTYRQELEEIGRN